MSGRSPFFGACRRYRDFSFHFSPITYRPANHTSGRSVEFAGIGMQMPALAAAAVRDFVAANLPSLLPKAETACKAVKVTIGPRNSGYADAILPANI
jgi:hypothetical protein